MRFVLLTALLTACASPAPPETHDAPTSGTRVRLPWVEFDIWTDYLSMEVGLSDSCTFLDPLVDNDSVRVPPIQVFWVIYQNENDIVEGTRVEDTFWIGDVFSIDQYPTIDGMDPIGFKYPIPAAQRFLKIEEIEVSDDRGQVDARFGSPLDVRLRAVADAESCALTTTYCVSPCDEPDRALDHIEVDLGFLNSVQDVAYVEP